MIDGIAPKDVELLTAFLGHEDRMPECLGFPEACGFIFNIVSAPTLVGPREWLPSLLGDEAAFGEVAEANEVLQALMRVYNQLNSAVLEENVAAILPPPPADLAEYSAPDWEKSFTSRWITGFFEGHEWLDSSWMEALMLARLDAQEALGGIELNFDVMESQVNGRLVWKEMSDPDLTFQQLFEDLRGDFTQCAVNYAALGRRLYLQELEREPSDSGAGDSEAGDSTPGASTAPALGPTEIADLTAFLTQARRSEDAFTYHQLRGFLFAVVTAPDEVPPSEWLPIAFGKSGPNWADLSESDRIMPIIMRLYDHIEASVSRGETGKLPSQLPDPDAFLAGRQPALEGWVFGMMAGHSWLEECWMGECRRAQLDYEEVVVSALYIMLGFSSPKALRHIWKDGKARRPFEDFVVWFAELFPEALEEYARLGWALGDGVDGGE